MIMWRTAWEATAHTAQDLFLIFSPGSLLAGELTPLVAVWKALRRPAGIRLPPPEAWSAYLLLAQTCKDRVGPRKTPSLHGLFFYFLFFSTFEGLISDRSFNFGLVASIFQGKTSPWSEISLHFTSRGRFAWYMLYFVSSQNIVSNLNLGKKKKLDHTAYSLHCGGRTSSTRKK